MAAFDVLRLPWELYKIYFRFWQHFPWGRQFFIYYCSHAWLALKTSFFPLAMAYYIKSLKNIRVCVYIYLILCSSISFIYCFKLFILYWGIVNPQTMLWWFQVTVTGTQPYIYRYPFSPKFPSQLGRASNIFWKPLLLLL